MSRQTASTSPQKPNMNTPTTAATSSSTAATDTAASPKFANKTLQDYEVISVIGNGSFGTCYKVRDKQTNELFAWKGIDYDELSESKKASLVSEINVLRQLQHPNIVQYYHHLVNHQAKSIFIVMECCEGGDLAQLITKARSEGKRFEERYIWRVLFQICKALQLCHNKIKEGTILHRDIKPANIFLDTEGNAKLGDFGLARVLRRNECFAQSFVGTPYYMSPEIVKGAKYDRKSDVWAVGCLVYEMCALRPPFKGREFEQLSHNISNGQFSCIPEVYSKDLQEMIAFMLEVENEQRPSIEVIIRHPVVVRNINDLGNEFPQLIAAEADFYIVSECFSDARCKLEYPDFSSTTHTEQYSFNVGYGQRRLSITGVFTPDLRTELFYSAKRRIFPKCHNNLQNSDPELYESIRREDYASIDGGHAKQSKCRNVSPTLLTKDIFDQTLQARLHAIRAQENLLQQKEQALNARERELNEQEKRLQELESVLNEKSAALEAVKRLQERAEQSKKSLPVPLERARLPLPPTKPTTAAQQPPPVPPRKPLNKHDDTYCTIEPNDTMMQLPTVAKLDLATLPAPKAFPTLRKVTFQSPKKFISYDIENAAQPQAREQKPPTASTTSNANQMQTSVSSKGSDDSAESSSSQQRRKSILSIFGLSRNNKDTTAKQTQAQVPVAISKERASVTMPAPMPQPPLLLPRAKEQEILAKCETSDLSNRWTKEHKRAAFDLLAAMNAAESNGELTSKQLPHAASTRHKLRQSVRDRHTHSLQRNRMRRSLMVGGTQPTTNSIAITREQLVV